VAGRIHSLAGLSLLLLAGAGRAAGPGPAVDAAVDAADQAPSAELLLFLAEFQDARGNDVDPIALAEHTEGDRTPKLARPSDSKAPTKEAGERDEPRHEPPR